MMNPGPVEEAGKVATGIVGALASQPLALSLVLMNIGLMVIFYVVLDRVDSHQLHREQAALAEQKEVRELLSHCIIPGGKT